VADDCRTDSEIRDKYEVLAAATVAERADECHRRREFDHESWRELSENGVWRIPVPEEMGGLGGNWWDFVSAFQGIARGGRDLGFCLSMVAQTGLIRALVRDGTPSQRESWLPRLLSGQVSSMALTEESGGSDISKMSVTAEAGSGRLHGAKVHITNAPVADLALVLGRSGDLDRGADATLFLVDLHAPGTERGAAETMMGNHSSPTGRLDFHGADIGADGVLGRPGGGLALIHGIMAFDRLLYGVLAAAYLEPLVDEMMDFVHERRAFHAPLADHQYVQGRITDTRFALESTRWVSYGALESLLEDRPDAALLCSIAKFQAAESLRTGTEDALRVFGHAGYEEGRVSRSVRDALGTLIAGGTAEMQRKNAFTQMCGLRRARG
jgi:alkylation response protein AidB-like acyl-CoA dehydrogenase